MKVHPLAQIVPPYSADELDRLIDSMKKGGFDPHRPIVMLDGMILDGRHRYEAAVAAGVEPLAEDWTPAFDGDSPAFFVLRSTHHRTLTSAQRAALAADLLPEMEKQAKVRMVKGKADPVEKVPQGRRRPPSKEEAARAAGTNAKYVEVAAKAKASAPEILEKMRRGEVTVPQAKAQIEKRKAPQRPEPEPESRLPEHIQEQVDAFKEVINAIRAAKRRAHELSQTEAGVELAARWKRFESAMDTAAETVKFATPLCSCPFMPTCETGNCKACSGRKWITKNINDALPEGMRK